MKKFFKFLLIGLGVLILLFSGIGLLKPEITYQNSILVIALPEEAFSVFKDTSSMKLWITGLKRIEFLEGNMDAPGSKWKLFLDQNGSHYEMTETMTAYEENKRFAFLLDNQVLTSEVYIRFTPSVQGTIISVDNKVAGKNLLLRSLFVITQGYFKNQSQKMYDNLKMLIDKSQVSA